MHVLFGTVLALNDADLILIGIVTTATLIPAALFWRALVAECLDPLFLRSVSRRGGAAHFLFLGLAVLNRVAGFQALGTLLSVGLMILPAASARFWVNNVLAMCLRATGFGVAASLAGLLRSYPAGLPSGPAIILSAGGVYLFTVLAGPRGVLRPLWPARNHRTARLRERTDP